ncbi:MAG: (Fe-S)-binding protein, partial [Methylotenera sp.]
PNNVNYGALVDTSRALFIPKKSVWLSLAKPLIRHRPLQYAFGSSVWLIQILKLNGLLERLLPAAKLLPKLKKPTLWKTLYLANKKSTTRTLNKNNAVSLFLGCASNTLDNDTLKASIYVLNQLGVDVHVPARQTCCGSIARQMGDANEAQKLVALNQASFDDNMPIISIASGCGAGLNDYLPAHEVQDISAFLMTCDWENINIAALNEHIYVQDPCTLRNVQKSQLAAYSLLNQIPQATISALANNGQCCGGAGAYMLTKSEMANNLRNDKITAIKTHNVARLATSNIGCSLHIAEGLREQHLDVVVEHPIQIIAKQMGYVGIV